MNQNKTFHANGETFALSTICGEVLATDSRSDTHVQGSGFVAGNNGNVYGQSTVNSIVKVTRNIWYRKENGQEDHWVCPFDLPVRVGNHIEFTFMKGPRVTCCSVDSSGKDKYDFCNEVMVGVRIVETDNFFMCDAYNRKGQFNGIGHEPFYYPGWKLFLGGLAGCLFFGIGGAVLAYLLIRTILLSTGSTMFGMPQEVSDKNRTAIFDAFQNEMTVMRATANAAIR